MLYPTRATYQCVPEEMRHPRVKRWVCFQCIPQPDGKISKHPIHPTGRPASISDCRTWSNLDDCITATEWCVGNACGFALGSDYKMVFIDLDHCILSDGSITPTAAKYIERLAPANPYIERSISGTGIHIFVWFTGTRPPIHPEPGVEMYTEGRFAVITGVPL